jgi:signal transduction histidine kinase
MAAASERRRIERDLHDGVQQHLVGIAVNLRLARELAPIDPAGADALLA